LHLFYASTVIEDVTLLDAVNVLVVL